MTAVNIQTATAADRETLIQILLLSFATDPCTRYTMATPQAFIAGFPGFSMGMGGGGIDHGAAFLTSDYTAAALWLPPGVTSDRATYRSMSATVSKSWASSSPATSRRSFRCFGQPEPDPPAPDSLGYPSSTPRTFAARASTVNGLLISSTLPSSTPL